MKSDELAFLNFQLAGMLQSGIPLEGALRQLSSTLHGGELKSEFEKLEADLRQGVPIGEAISRRRFPELYRRMVMVGIKGNDLPGVLTLLADYYQRTNATARRLKGLLVYPVIVLLASLALSFFLAVFFRTFSEDMPRILNEGWERGVGEGTALMLWLPAFFLSIITAFMVAVLTIPPLRRWLRWHVPGFKEAGLAQLASAMRLLLKSGTGLGDALALMRSVESKTPAGADLASWERRLAAGHAHFAEIAADSRVVPPLFGWLVSSAGEDMAEGFGRAAEVYQARAAHRTEMFLYAALPVSVLFLGAMLLSQAYPVMRLFVQMGSLLDALGQ
jgi:type II secretory pathway component PulF